MAIIYTYPRMVTVNNGDLLLISAVNTPRKPTMRIRVEDVKGYMNTCPTITDCVGSTGALNEVLTANGTGGVVWSPASGGGSIPWPYQYDLGLSLLIQGENPGTAGNNTTAFGVNAGTSLTSGSHSVFIGSNAGATRTSTGSNVYIGSNSGTLATDGEKNVAIGRAALYNETNSDSCVAVGSNALLNQNNAGGFDAHNTAVGANAGNTITTGFNNTILGSQSTTSAVSDNNSIIVGYNITGNGTNSITIGNTTNSGLSLPGSLPAFDDDAAAGVGGLTINMLYQTTGAGAAPLNTAGIVMIKQ